MEINYDELLEKAKEVSKNSYSPYSKFKVGAAVMFESGKVYCGANVENVSYGITLCAERSAISSAISSGEKTKIKAINHLSCTMDHLMRMVIFIWVIL